MDEWRKRDRCLVPSCRSRPHQQKHGVYMTVTEGREEERGSGRARTERGEEIGVAVGHQHSNGEFESLRQPTGKK